MRDPREWDEDYVQQLSVGEFDWIEVKGRRGLDLSIPTVKEKDVRANLSKAISAFANSGGGTLVFGLEDPAEEWVVDDGGIDLSINNGTREWLEDVIPHLVDDKLRKFNVYAIQRSGENSQIVEGRGIFIIDIGDSDDAPHQAEDKKYYARVGGKSRPIGHRLVRDIFGRRKYPLLQPEFRLVRTIDLVKQGNSLFDTTSVFTSPKPRSEKRHELSLEIKVRNMGRIVARNMQCFVYVPVALVDEWGLMRLNQDDLEEFDNLKYVGWGRQNTRRDVVDTEYKGMHSIEKYGPSWFDPILPQLAYSWEWSLNSKMINDTILQSYLYWEIYCDDAPFQQGKLRVDDIESIVVDNTD